MTRGSGTVSLSGNSVVFGAVIIGAGALSLDASAPLDTASSVSLTNPGARLIAENAGAPQRINNLSGVAGSMIETGSKGLEVKQTESTIVAVPSRATI